LTLTQALLTIPSQDMKRRLAQKLNGRPHFVPLATAGHRHLERASAPHRPHGRYVFPSLRTGERAMSDNTINAALRRMGFASDEMSAHGFRAMARTLMIERIPGISADVIEAQLAHGKSGPLGAAYDRAEFMEQRRRMMSEWADYLDKLRMGAEVIQFKKA
jgi:integrase